MRILKRENKGLEQSRKCLLNKIHKWRQANCTQLESRYFRTEDGRCKWPVAGTCLVPLQKVSMPDVSRERERGREKEMKQGPVITQKIPP